MLCRPPRSTLFPYTTLFPSLLTIVIPPLLFEGALHLSPAHLRAYGLLVALLAIPGTLVAAVAIGWRSEEHTSELQSLTKLVCRLLLEKKIFQALAWGMMLLP